ncbi:MAG: dephospho-CoA kinase [Clostridia bacterium]|nr:dephospho-CoA kinase [Clostridia bacterium]
MIIGLTGGIGSGKTAALAALKKNGYKTVSCDEITAELYRRRKTLEFLRAEFPSAIKGRFFLKADKKEIARIIFSDKGKYAFLKEFLTRQTFAVAMRRAKKHEKKSGVAIVEVPLLFENDLTRNFDKILVITRDKNARIAAVKARSELSEEEIAARVSAQIDYDNFDFSAFTVIKNDGNIDDLAAAALSAVKSFL